MKKTLIAVAAAAALTTSAFAEITFGAWLRVLAAPLASDGKDTVAAMGNSWGWGARTARLDINANAEDGKIGFKMGVFNDCEGGIAQGDDAFIWAKPVDSVKVSYGRYDNPTPLRGDFCYGSWDWLRPTSSWMVEDEGLLMSGKHSDGVKVEITPVDGLYILALLPIKEAQEKVDRVFKNSQFGFGYSIEGVGKIKAQWFGDTTAKDADSDYLDSTIEAAFDLTAVENLYVGVGFQYKMIASLDDRATLNGKEKMRVSLGTSFQVSDELKVSASGAYQMYQKSKDDGGKDPRFQAGFGVAYNLGDGMNLSADVRYLAKENDVEKTDHMAFSVGVTKGISSNGYMGVAFEAQTNGGDWANNVITHNADKADKLTWCVPVAISCWF